MSLYQKIVMFVTFVWKSRHCKHEWIYPKKNETYRKICMHCQAERPWEHE